MKKGFTLSEVLITLAVIGIVASLTIPNLSYNYQKTAYVTQLQKVINQLSNAAIQFRADQKSDDLSETDLYSSTANNFGTLFFNKYFKVVKDCGVSNATNCYASSYKNLDGTTGNALTSSSESFYCVILNSSATVCLKPFTGSNNAKLHIDVNGPKNPNTWCRDAFILEMNSKGELTPNSADNSKCITDIINAGWKMNY